MAEMEPHVFIHGPGHDHRCAYTNAELERCGKSVGRHLAERIRGPDGGAMGSPEGSPEAAGSEQSAFDKWLDEYTNEHGAPYAVGAELRDAWHAAWEAALNQGETCLDPECQHAASHHQWRYPYVKPHCTKCGGKCNTPEA